MRILAGWDVDGIFQFCESQNCTIESAVFTHRHWDHTGGKLPRSMTRGREVSLPGVVDYVEKGCQVYLGKGDVKPTAAQCGLKPESLRSVTEGDAIPIGKSALKVLATPGHTPGSICFLLETSTTGGMLFTGDTLFIGSCGRVGIIFFVVTVIFTR